MNALQYKVVKSVLACGANPKTFAKMIKVDHAEVLRVQATASYEQYQNNDTPLEDLMRTFMGGK